MEIYKGNTVEQYLYWWLNNVIGDNVRYNTFVSYEGYIRNHISRLIGTLNLTELKPENIQGFIVALTTEHKIGPRTISLIIGMLNNALSYAEEYEYIFRNPCRRLKLPKIEETEVEVYTDEEQKKIQTAVMQSKDNRHFGIIIALYTGLRIGELCGLKWEMVDFIHACIYVKVQLGREKATAQDATTKTVLTLQNPKTTTSKREIQIPQFLCTELKKRKDESNSEFVISMKNGSYVQPRCLQNIYKKLMLNIGVPYYKFHALRHTFATRAAELNTDPKTVSVTLGHKNAMITINRYTHSLLKQKIKMTENLNAYFESSIEQL